MNEEELNKIVSELIPKSEYPNSMYMKGVADGINMLKESIIKNINTKTIKQGVMQSAVEGLWFIGD